MAETRNLYRIRRSCEFPTLEINIENNEVVYPSGWNPEGYMVYLHGEYLRPEEFEPIDIDYRSNDNIVRVAPYPFIYSSKDDMMVENYEQDTWSLCKNDCVIIAIELQPWSGRIVKDGHYA